MILFLDDEDVIELFVSEFQERGLPVVFFSEIDKALEYIQRTADSVEVAVLDVMMPPGNHLTLIETQDGLITGIRFYEMLRKQFPRCLVYFFTNLNSGEVLHHCRLDGDVTIVGKGDILYDEFADEVEARYKNNLFHASDVSGAGSE